MTRIIFLILDIALFFAAGIAYIGFFGFFLGLFGVGIVYADGDIYRFTLSLIMFVSIFACAATIAVSGTAFFIRVFRDIWSGNY